MNTQKSSKPVAISLTGNRRGATYFVTFRLADSVPASLLKEWEARTRSLAQTSSQTMGLRRTAYEYQRRFIESREDWLDQGHGSCLLRDNISR